MNKFDKQSLAIAARMKQNQEQAAGRRDLRRREDRGKRPAWGG